MFMLQLQNVINWIVSSVYTYFKPKITFSKKFESAISPTRGRDGVGFNLYTPKDIYFERGQRRVVDTGILFEFPSYLSMFVSNIPSMAIRSFSVHGGVIYSDYKDSIGIVIQNDYSEKVKIPKGSAIALVVFHLIIRSTLTKRELSEKERDEKAFDGNWEWNMPKANLKPNDP